MQYKNVPDSRTERRMVGWRDLYRAMISQQWYRLQSPISVTLQHSIHRSVSVTHIWLSLGVQLRRHSVPAMTAAAAAAPAAGAAATRIAACGFA